MSTLPRSRDDARSVLEDKGAKANEQLIGELVDCKDREAMEQLVEGWSPAKLGRRKPEIGRLTESIGSFPSDHKSFVRELTRR